MTEWAIQFILLGQMTRIGLLSDTHIPVDAKTLPAQIKEVFHDVDLILHAGDIYIVPVLDELERIAPVLAARGDDDTYEVTNDRRVKEKHTLTVDGITISAMHIRPWIGPWVAFHSATDDLDPASPHHVKVSEISVFGHTHVTRVANRDGFLLINPGSPTFPYYLHQLGTVALLTLNSGEAQVRIVQLE